MRPKKPKGDDLSSVVGFSEPAVRLREKRSEPESNGSCDRIGLLYSADVPNPSLRVQQRIKVTRTFTMTAPAPLFPHARNCQRK
jgi:hypothetical protein